MLQVVDLYLCYGRQICMGKHGELFCFGIKAMEVNAVSTNLRSFQSIGVCMAISNAERAHA